MFKSLTGIGNLVRNFSNLRQRVEELKQQLGRERIESVSTCQTVRIEMDGLGQVHSVQISEAICLQTERSRMEQLLLETVNQGLQAARRKHLNAVRELTEGIEIPGIDSLLESLER
jgi:DNA-binding protein YbaB